jgi:diaminopimelate epimerase
VRVDGIAFVRTVGSHRPVRMTYFDRDGTNASMCGNALRCVTRYGNERGYLRADEDVVMTDDGPKWVSAADGAIRVALGAGREFQRVTDDRYFVFSGVAHLVVLLDENQDLDAIDVKTEGAALRYDELLCRRLDHPEGLHVDFMQRYENGVRIRTYEVGVEDETLACGTGSAASAYVANRVWGAAVPDPRGRPGRRDTGRGDRARAAHQRSHRPPVRQPPAGRQAPLIGLAPALAVGGSGG